MPSETTTVPKLSVRLGRGFPWVAPACSTNAHPPRGENKKKILAALNGGPKTASEIANETGVKTGTIGASQSKLAKAGEVVKADRGYALPTQARTIGSEHGL